MAKKTVTLFLLFAFFLFDMSCASIQVRGPSEISGDTSRTEVLSVITKSGEKVEFRKSDPGRVVQESRAIVGAVLQDLDVDAADIKTLYKNEKGQVLKVVMRDGSVYDVTSFTEEGERRRISCYAPITVPFSDIHQVWIRKDVTNKAILKGGMWMILGVAVAAALTPVVVWAVIKAASRGDDGRRRHRP